MVSCPEEESKNHHLLWHMLYKKQVEGGHPVQILSYDIENAFAKVSHKIITQSLRAFGIPELIIQALQQYTLIGYAKVEVNGKTGF